MSMCALSTVSSPSKTRTNSHTLDPKLHQGDKFLKWTDQDQVPAPVTVRVDPDGFYLVIVDRTYQKTDTTTLDLSQVQDIRTGSEARIPKDSKLRDQISRGSDVLEDNIVTIVYGTDFVNINYFNLFAIKAEVAQFWSEELEAYIRLRKPLMITAQHSLNKIYQNILQSVREDKNIPSKNLVRLFASSKEDRKVVDKALQDCGLPHGKNEEIPRQHFHFNLFKDFYLNLCQRKEIKTVFDACAKKDDDVPIQTDVIQLDQFLDFLNNIQRDSRLNEILHPYVTRDKATNLINKYEPNSELSSKGELSMQGFLWYLMSEDNNVISQDKLEKTETMEECLAHYYIKSSHNTYLMGHQITGRASLEMYRQVLLSGCRCIELDFWNGPKEEDEPIITHGYTFVSNLLARDVLQVISLYAFKASNYPLILSFENHCNPKQQAKIAKYCEEFFGDLMLQDALPDFPLQRDVALPSPAQLMNKILIKNKKQHHPHNVHKQASINNSISRTPSTPSSPTQHELPATPSHRAVLNNNNNCGDSESSDCDDSDTDDESSDQGQMDLATSDAGTAGVESSACAEISALVNYVQPVHFRSFEHAEKRRRAYEMSSFVETTALTQLKNDPLEFVKYNKFQLSRVYPKGTRVDSSNFLAQIYWNAGCQLVALNYQTLDTAMQLNLAIFQFNQGLGYLLKPEVLRRDDRVFDPFTQSSVDNIVPATLSIQVLSGQFLTDKHVNTYVEVEMYGLPCDTVRREKKFKTKQVQNGINPTFSEEPFVFRQIILPDLAVVRIAAYEEGSRLIGHRVLPVTGLNPGYRHIPLFNVAGQPLHLPCLFVCIEVKDYVPNRLNRYADALANPIKYQQDILAERSKALEALEDDECDGPPDLAKQQDTDTTSDCSSPSKSTLETSHRKVSAKPSGSEGVGVSSGSPTAAGAYKNLATRSFSQGATPAEDERKGSVSLLRKDLTPETVEDIFENRWIREKQVEMEHKLDILLKKKNKDHLKLEQAKTQATDKINKNSGKNKNPLQKNALNKIVKKFSTSGVEGSYTTTVQSPGTQQQIEHNINRVHDSHMAALENKYLKEEIEIKEKYWKLIYDAAEKAMLKSQANQIKSLDSLFNKESSEIVKKIDSEDKSQSGKHEDQNISKDELRKERMERLIKKGKQEKWKLQDMYDGRKREMEQAQAKCRQDLAYNRDKLEKQLKSDFIGRSEKIKEMYCKQILDTEEQNTTDKESNASTKL